MPVDAARVPPEIIRLPPPLVPARRIWVGFRTGGRLVLVAGLPGLVLVFGALAALAGGIGPALTGGLLRVFIAPLGGCAFMAMFMLVVVLWSRRKLNCAARRWRSDHPELLADPRVAAVVSAIDLAGEIDYRGLARILVAPTPAPPCCHIVCTANTEPPAVPDALIEPVVIGPSNLLPMREVPLIALLFGALFAMVLMVRFLPGALTTWVECCALVLLAGWLWYWVIRPQYIRFTPGLIEIMRYRLLGRRARGEQVPLDEETVLFVRNRPDPPVALNASRQKTKWSLIVCRRHRVTDLQFRTTRDQTERIWHALLSTARTPPLTYDTL